jgi:hypothetical protein
MLALDAKLFQFGCNMLSKIGEGILGGNMVHGTILKCDEGYPINRLMTYKAYLAPF